MPRLNRMRWRAERDGIRFSLLPRVSRTLRIVRQAASPKPVGGMHRPSYLSVCRPLPWIAVSEIDSPAAGSEKIHIREALRDDVESLAPLFREEAEFAQQLAGYFRLRQGFDWIDFVKARLAREDGTIIIAEQDARLIGFVSFRITGYPGTRQESSFLKLLARAIRSRRAPPIEDLSWGVIESYFVTSPFRRQGVGTALTASALKWFKNRGIDRVEISVLENNKISVMFAEKLGFRTFRLSMHRID